MVRGCLLRSCCSRAFCLPCASLQQSTACVKRDRGGRAPSAAPGEVLRQLPPPLPPPPPSRLPQATKTLRDVFDAFATFGAGGPVSGLEGRAFAK